MRGFDEEERAEIREALVDAGEEFFVRLGPQKTTVDDLVDAVGVSKGTFYTLFDSKDALFMEVFIRLGKEHVDDVLAAVEEIDDGQEGIRVHFRTFATWLEDHPVIQKFAADVDRARFRRNLPAEEWARAEQIRDGRLAEPVARWQTNGDLRDDVSALEIVGLLEPVLLLVVTTDDYDEEYRETRDFVIETLARGVAAP